MDIEGSEGEAFEGMKNILKKNKDIKVIAEFWGSLLDKSQVKAKIFIEMLSQRFELWDIDQLHNNIKKIDSINKFLEEYKQRNTNIFGVRKSGLD